MMTSEERIEELHRRMDVRKREKNLLGYRIRCASVIAACLAFVLVSAFAVSAAPVQGEIVIPNGVSGSIFAEQGTLGYVVVALLAFFLGVVATVICYRQRKKREEQDIDRNR